MRWLRKLQAKIVLACLFIGHLVGRIFFFWKRQDGLKRFLNQYAADAIYPISQNERNLLPSFQRCQACSLCTFSCTAIREGRAPGDFEPKFIMLGFGRSSHESEVFLEEWLPCLECGKCTVTCPNDVPIHAMVNQIMERRNRIAFRS